ncbi:Uncharacterized protein DAT39_000161 [Clarias magur]|uniref:Uncharacterized protein n=1 Tax=Clarias magur TaxID=1594786 RepID=A0A8J5BNH3_CLAMG|nr:Uncharacterized protein DAT39_000161 [Clarias magur]
MLNRDGRGLCEGGVARQTHGEDKGRWTWVSEALRQRPVFTSYEHDKSAAAGGGAGRSRGGGVQQRGRGEREGGARADQADGHASSEGAGQRSRFRTLAGAQRGRDKHRLQRLHLQDLLLQEDPASDTSQLH